MKKAVVVTAVVLAATGLFAAGQMQKAKQTVSPSVAASQDKTEAEGVEAQITEDPEIPSIDTDLNIRPASRIAVVSKSVRGEFWSLVRQGMESAVAKINEIYGFEKEDKIVLTFEGPESEQDIESQINIIDAVLSENPTVLCISAGDMEACQAQLENAAENGIPVMIFDSNVNDMALVGAYRGTDNLKVGEIAAEKLGNAIHNQGKIAIFSVNENTTSIQERVQGFRNYFTEYEEIEIVEELYETETENIQEEMQRVLTEYPDLAGVFCTNANIAETYLSISQEEGRDIKMVGVDGTTIQQQAVKDGKEIGFVSQHAYAVGYQTVVAAVQSMDVRMADQIELRHVIDPKWIDADNMDDIENSPYIYK